MHSAEEGSEGGSGVAVRILNGEKAGDIKTPPTPLCIAEIRLAADAALGDQRERPSAGEHGFLQAAHAVGNLPLADPGRLAPCSCFKLVSSRSFCLSGIAVSRRKWTSRQRMVELAHVNRFSTAGEMAASIAHEINQPLGAILNNAETAKIMLKSQSPDLKEMEEIVDDIRRDNSRATEVIGRLRSFMKKVPFERKNYRLERSGCRNSQISVARGEIARHRSAKQTEWSASSDQWRSNSIAAGPFQFDPEWRLMPHRKRDRQRKL